MIYNTYLSRALDKSVKEIAFVKSESNIGRNSYPGSGLRKFIKSKANEITYLFDKENFPPCVELCKH